MNGNLIKLDGKSLTIPALLAIAENKKQVDFTDAIWHELESFRKGLERQLVEHPDIQIYGTNVGCGDLKDVTISPEAFENYQIRFIRAHNCGTGKPLAEPVVRAIMVIRLNSFAKGFSGVRPETCRLMIDMLNRGVTPWVLEEGSVGASGDLVPLAMIGAVLLGFKEAKAYYLGQLLAADEALEKAGLHPTRLGAKEAMGLTNGSSFIAGLAVFAWRKATNILKHAAISGALSLEAIRGEKDAFSDLILESRPHRGQMAIGKTLRALIEGSRRMTADAQRVEFPGQHKETVKERVQDRYSFRAIPQVHGAFFEALDKLHEVLLIEINSATDNPLFILNNGWYIAKSGANFHGQPLAAVIDYAKLTLTGLTLITNKRVFAILDKAQSYGLPQDLAADPCGGDTGLMISQYAASARAAESRILSFPASVTSISTAANQEDFVSMGSIGAIHFEKVIYNAEIVVAVELLCSTRSLQMTCNLLPESLRQLAPETQKVFDYLNEILPPISQDQYLRLDMEKMISVVQSGDLLQKVQDSLTLL